MLRAYKFKHYDLVIIKILNLGVLKKLIEKNVFDFPSLWKSFCEMVVKHPNKFLPVLRYAPNQVRKKFFDI